MSTNSEKGRRNNILLVAITRMGDMLQASPTIVGLKEENPEARITVLIERGFAAICEGIPGIDEIYTIDLAFVCRCLAEEKAGIVEAFAYVSEKIEELRNRNFDYCLNMSSSGYTALLLKMLDVKDSRGWISDDEGQRLISSPWAMLFAAFVYHSNRDYNSINLVDILRCSAGVTAHPCKLVYHVPESAKSYPDELFNQLGWTNNDGPLICIQAGASQDKRQWLPEKFAYLSRLLVERLNARLVFTGTRSEAPIVEGIFKAYSHPNMTSLVGTTNLAQLSAVLERASVLITGDTGPMHLAVAVGTPVVSLFLASALCFETGPYGVGNLVLQPLISCSPCNPNFPCARPDCHEQAKPELVFELAQIVLNTPADKVHEVRIDLECARPEEVAVYATVFDADGFLDFKQLNGNAARHGLTPEYFQRTRDAYRMLWKEEFEGISARKTDSGEPAEDDAFLRLSQGVREIRQLADRGIGLLSELQRLIRDVQSPPRLLGELNEKVNQVDRELEDVGLSYPVLGAIVRMFVMEKENMRGEDPLALTDHMLGLYRVLFARALKFDNYVFDRQS